MNDISTRRPAIHRPLGELVTFLDHKRRPVKESDRKPGPYPYLGANGPQGMIDDYLFDEPLVLLAEDGGHFEEPERGIAYRVSGKIWVNNHAHVLRPNPDVDWAYLELVLKNRDIRPYISGTTRGKLTKGQAEKIEIPMPPLREQRRIAAILDEADALRAKRRAALAQLDEMAQAIFAQMFGDPLEIERKWPSDILGTFLEFLTSGSRGWATHYADKGELFLRIQNVHHDQLLLDDVAFVNAPVTAEAKRTKVEQGDVLLSITADLGRTAVIPDGLGTAYINQHLAILRTKTLNSRFLSAFLTSPGGQEQIFRRNKQGVKAGLNFDDIRSFRIPNPPCAIQNLFAMAIRQLDILAERQMQAMDQLDSLFASLQHRAFRGEL